MTSPKGPVGTPVDSFTDFMGNEIRIGMNVIVGQRDGNDQRMWTAVVHEIRECRRPWGQGTETKALIQATGFYTQGASRHNWPTYDDAVLGRPVLTGERPKPTWTLCDRIVLGPCQFDSFFRESVEKGLTSRR